MYVILYEVMNFRSGGEGGGAPWGFWGASLQEKFGHAFVARSRNQNACCRRFFYSLKIFSYQYRKEVYPVSSKIAKKIELNFSFNKKWPKTLLGCQIQNIKKRNYAL